MIVYGATMGVSITDMFLGSIIPGLLFALILIFVNKLILRNKNIDTGTEKYTFKDKLYATKSAFGALLLPVIILGGIYGGIFTPTEAAATGSVYSLIIGLLYKDLDKKKLISILKRTVETSSCVILVVGVSSVFSWLVTVTRVPNVVSEIILSNITNKYVYLAVLTVLLFLVGALLDGLVNVVILAPIVVPAGISLGVDPLHMGVLFCVCLVVGFITPPFGINLFTSASVSKLSYGEVVKGALPYMIGLAIGSVIVVFVPVLSLFLLNII
jgi:C4-dicarboxylate transporter DctM subunit